MKILLLCSAFNGLSQRAWIELRGDGHEVTVEIAVDEEAIRRAVAVAEPDLVICPFLRERVPADVLTHRRTIIVHPGTQRRPGTFLIGLGDHRRRTSLGGHRPAGGGGDGCRARLV